ncbi:uncharacterized protein LOC121738794 [Aricia agestis]|uniref:uncharacterized protein LOC121738794 n=1 Tax=Aricia agestis TaxID=91739 RepID=UPI001C20A90F|nr:uncharacterized protein LOC121738794 [Aricia agestis]
MYPGIPLVFNLQTKTFVLNMARFLALSMVLATTIAIATVESRSTAVEVSSVDKQFMPRCWNNSLSGISCANMLTNSPDRLYPHPHDCQIFYVCLTPQLPPICLECPLDLYFDAKKNICDYPENVSCTA